MTPAQYPDFAALRGDPSDNLPGVPGVGEKTAAKWIREYGSLDGVGRATSTRCTGKAGQSLREHLARWSRNRRLNRARRRAATCRCSIDDLARAALGPRRGAPGLRRPASSGCCASGCSPRWRRPSPRPRRAFDVEVERPGAGGLARLAGRAHGHRAIRGRRSSGRWGAWHRRRSTRSAVAGADGAAAYVDPARSTRRARAGARRLAGRPRPPKALHDAKGPLLAARARGWRLAGVTSDTALAAYLVRPGQRSFDLDDLVLRYLGRELRAGRARRRPADARRSRRRRPAVRRPRSVRRPRRARPGRRRSTRSWPSRSSPALLGDLELPLVDVLAEMEAAGIAVDAEHLDDARGALRRRGRGRPPTRRTRWSAARSTSARPSSCRSCCSTSWACPRPSGPRPATPPTPRRCRRCYDKTGHPFLEHLLRHRDASRLRSPVEGLHQVGRRRRPHPHHVQPDHRGDRAAVVHRPQPAEHPDPHRRRAAGSGRRSSSATGYESLMTADYSQIEMRIMAHLSEDAGLIEAFRTGEDLHRFVGARVFGVPPRRGHPRDARQDQGDVATAWPTACRRSACPSSSTSPPGRPGR